MLDETVFQGRRLAIVGSICRDVKLAPLPPGDYLFADGETPTAAISETIGGGGANSALAAAALGADVRFAGKLGDDPLGTRLEEALRRRGATPLIRRDPRVASGSSVVLNFTNGCRHFVSSQPNNVTLAFDDIDLRVLDGAHHLLRADIWFSQPMLAEGNARLLAAARQRGLATSLDLNWDPQWGWAGEATIAARKEAVRRLLPLVDLVHGNVRELNRFAGADDLMVTLDRLTTWGAGAVVVHLGADGAGYYAAGQLTVAPCVPVETVKNLAGSGDLLSTCMILLHGQGDIPVAQKLALANRVVADFIAGRREVLPAV